MARSQGLARCIHGSGFLKSRYSPQYAVQLFLYRGLPKLNHVKQPIPRAAADQQEQASAMIDSTSCHITIHVQMILETIHPLVLSKHQLQYRPIAI